MRLVIDIPEEMYQNVLNGTYCGTLYEELKNGTPLDNIKSELISEYNSHTNEWSYCAGLQKAIELLDRKEKE